VADSPSSIDVDSDSVHLIYGVEALFVVVSREVPTTEGWFVRDNDFLCLIRGGSAVLFVSQ